MGWTLDELIAYADAHEGAELFDGASKSSILYYCLTYNMDSFVDWSTGECKFDTPEFKSLLEFVNVFFRACMPENDISHQLNDADDQQDDDHRDP